jgi:hypothetical protein
MVRRPNIYLAFEEELEQISTSLEISASEVQLVGYLMAHATGGIILPPAVGRL